jgi:hypothetical protein
MRQNYLFLFGGILKPDRLENPGDIYQFHYKSHHSGMAGVRLKVMGRTFKPINASWSAMLALHKSANRQSKLCTPALL